MQLFLPLQDDDREVTSSRLTFIDLAGSERVSRTAAGTDLRSNVDDCTSVLISPRLGPQHRRQGPGGSQKYQQVAVCARQRRCCSSYLLCESQVRRDSNLAAAGLSCILISRSGSATVLDENYDESDDRLDEGLLSAFVPWRDSKLTRLLQVRNALCPGTQSHSVDLHTHSLCVAAVLEWAFIRLPRDHTVPV